MRAQSLEGRFSVVQADRLELLSSLKAAKLCAMGTLTFTFVREPVRARTTGISNHNAQRSPTRASCARVRTTRVKPFTRHPKVLLDAQVWLTGESRAGAALAFPFRLR